MELFIYNTLHREKRLFSPLTPGKVGIYVCGVTTYDLCHIGHARVMTAFDTIVRCLRAFGYDTRYVRNITDIDDKIINRANECNEDWSHLTERYIRSLNEDVRALGLLVPDEEPRATRYIAQIISLINRLLEKKHAYVGENGDVYYSVPTFSEYGKLSGQHVDDLIAGARIEPGEFKRHPSDFVLWKVANKDAPGWNSPWGWGRPGWHIECSAMSMHFLGESFDIHGGGPDLVFPHHENEIAQSQGASGKVPVQWWMHVGAVRVRNEKMSKSLGNFVSLRKLLQTYKPEVIRYFLLSSHYRSPIDYAPDMLLSARRSLERLYQALRFIPEEKGRSELNENDPVEKEFLFHLADDFNVPGALSVMFDLVRELNSTDKDKERVLMAGKLRAMGRVLNILGDDPSEFFAENRGDERRIEELIERRQRAKEEKDFVSADALREELNELGIVVEDQPGKTVWRRK